MRPVYLYITPFFPSPTSWSGGFCLDAVRAIRADGRYEVIVMTASGGRGKVESRDEGDNGEGAPDYVYDGIKVYRFPRIRIGASEYFETLLAPINNWLFLRKLKKILIARGLREKVESRDEVDICHVHDFEHYIQYALCLKRKLKGVHRLITLVHHHYAGYYKLDIGKFGVVPIWSDLLYLKMRREFESVDAHVFISKHCQSKYGRRVDFDAGEDLGLLKDQLPWGRLYRPIRCPRAIIAYNGVDTSLFHTFPRNQQPTTNNQQPIIIGCVANFNPCKSQIDLIRAMEIVVDEVGRKGGGRSQSFRVVFVGSGKTLETCKQAAAEIEKKVNHRSSTSTLNFDFLPPMLHDQLPAFYRTLDLFVMPSVNEGFCCVNVEAHACGVPFLAVKGLPMEEILPPEDHTKWLFAAHNIDDLADRIVAYVANHPTQRLTVDLESKGVVRKAMEEVGV